MIEIVDASRCTACNICVHACPTNVFDVSPAAPPRIARQDDCQTCFMCELYCPEDALFVAPLADRSYTRDDQAAVPSTLLGSYRRAIGWGRGREPTARLDASFELLARAR